MPRKPGVYIFLNDRSHMLYVGKAKSLRARVRSYFTQRDPPVKIASLRKEVADIETILTDSEVEALSLENNLIKEHQPRYNVLLRDDKNYPYIKITISEPCPKVEIVRYPKQDGDRYFGPFIPGGQARKMLSLLHQHFHLRQCPGGVEDKTSKGCLYFQLDQCQGPCDGHVSQAEYREMVDAAILFLRGQVGDLIPKLQQKMREAADRCLYEKAAHYRDLIRLARSRVRGERFTSTRLEDMDIFGLARQGRTLAVQVFLMRGGIIAARRNFVVKNGNEEDPTTLLSTLLTQYYQIADIPREVLLPFPISDRMVVESYLSRLRGRKAYLKVPQRGRKRDLVLLAEKNADLALSDRARREEADPLAALEELQKQLGLPELPLRIEAFDISHLHGSDAVGSMVVWEGDRFKKDQYRRFQIRTAQGPDDYLCLQEAVRRRYSRLQAQAEVFPNLVLIDGGKGHLRATQEVLREVGLVHVPAASIAKREEAIFSPQGDPILLDRRAPALHLIQRIRDETHRFAVQYHRTRRSHRAVHSLLDEIPGIGAKRKKKLLQRFGSVEGLKVAPLDDVTSVVGPAIAQRIQRFFEHLGEERTASLSSSSSHRRHSHGNPPEED